MYNFQFSLNYNNSMYWYGSPLMIACHSSHDSAVFDIMDYFTNYEDVTFSNTTNVCDTEYNLSLLVYKIHFISKRSTLHDTF